MTVYFVRHAQSDNRVHEDAVRPLTEKGLHDRQLVTAYLQDKGVSRVFSSPYKRTVDTVAPFAQSAGLDIQMMEAFRERCVGGWVEDFSAFAQKQWRDLDYKWPGGESLREVQQRNVKALFALADKYPDETIAIGTHGTALSTVIHYFDSGYGYSDFAAIENVMPLIVKMEFADMVCREMAVYDLYTGRCFRRI